MSSVKLKKLDKIFVILLCVVSFFYFNGCDEDNTLIPVVSTSFLSIYNVSMFAGNVAIVINGTAVASDVSYTERVNYQQLISGNNRVEIFYASSSVLFDTTFFLAENNYYSFYIYNAGGVIEPLIVTDNNTSPGNTNASVRFINFAEGTGSVDMGAEVKTTPWFPFSDYAEVENYRPITGGTYDLYLRNAGTPTNIATLNSQAMSANIVYTILGKGIAGGTGNAALGLVVYLNQY